MDVMYIINKTRLSPSGTKVVIVRQADASGVVLVDNGDGVHSTRLDNLTDRPPNNVEPEKENPLKIGMLKQLSKMGRTKFKALVGAVQDGLISTALPEGVTKEQWLLTAKETIDGN